MLHYLANYLLSTYSNWSTVACEDLAGTTNTWYDVSTKHLFLYIHKNKIKEFVSRTYNRSLINLRWTQILAKRKLLLDMDLSLSLPPAP